MDLVTWPENLAAAYSIGSSEATTRRHLKSLERSRRFPMPGELQEIATELREDAEQPIFTQYLARMREEWCPGAEENTFDPMGDAA